MEILNTTALTDKFQFGKLISVVSVRKESFTSRLIIYDKQNHGILISDPMVFVMHYKWPSLSRFFWAARSLAAA